MENISKDNLPYNVIEKPEPKIQRFISSIRGELVIRDLKDKVEYTIDVPVCEYIVMKDDKRKDGFEISVGWNGRLRDRLLVIPPPQPGGAPNSVSLMKNEALNLFAQQIRNVIRKRAVGKEGWLSVLIEASKARRSMRLTHDPRKFEV